ncbi:MAG: hypothetical protein HOD43_07830 [Candidatus Marinimicrobia bacterium]|jgi:hypothetical protein|nr:hypothetical protein [Candidatus Neomarinimicrobiota bacterium]MBT3630918.1 hypothetical protein [Candidatus Neomarinimicrobiota bacterium]MBT3826190.1 hypothetical protein [Candidatus Neomarinimicrobiota bacterium]MBT4130906.1 hypothetical protein [Candidatus Neomarinimicrobiota bacterium]MBT4295699.1 hypothetical protein [Candidatus Neomarinimicrobiota bacterium]
MKKLALLMIIVSLSIWTCSSKHKHPGASAETCTTVACENPDHKHASGVSQEHGGQEHGGKEHGGQEHGGKEHAGQEHGGEAAQNFSAAEIKGAMNAHIAMREVDGVFTISDEKTGEDLKLKFVKIHDPVRKIEGKGYFACTDFEVIGESGKLYDLDFWLNPEGGSLKVTEEKIHKNPKKTDAGWEKKARYTFINDNPVEID